jgi:glycosyltransferase involved in cell wall biosynthesis
MAAAEAIAHGVPVIAHPTPGVIENLGDAAVYVDRDDIDGIAEAILTIQGNPAPFRAAALARAQQHAMTSRAQVSQWVAAIENLGR